jgi:C1A family cysteine protease
MSSENSFSNLFSNPYSCDFDRENTYGKLCAPGKTSQKPPISITSNTLRISPESNGTLEEIDP